MNRCLFEEIIDLIVKSTVLVFDVISLFFTLKITLCEINSAYITVV